VAANWKMHLLAAAARDYCARLQAGVEERRWSADQGPEAVVFPSHPLVPLVAAALHPGAVTVGGQDLHPASEGAHTGDVSGPQLVDAGASWVLCGHSERRRDHGEGDALVGRKVAAARAAGLQPVLCLGETAEERSAGRTWEVLDRQLTGGLDVVEPAGTVVLAYEPVWAIGTGLTATPATAQEVHAHLRRRLAERLSPDAAARVRILYGGSVKPDNAAALFAEPDIDGFLVGGASLDPEKFLAIMEASA
jgi:triosephosphate isomerase